jgi:hypothetical protein
MEGKHVEIEVSGNEKVSWLDSEIMPKKQKGATDDEESK